MSNKLFVGRLSSRTTQEDLEALFKKYGVIKKLNVKLGYAFVDYEENHEAEDAIAALNGTNVDDSNIVVEISKGPRDPRDRDARPNRPTFNGRGYKVVIEGIARGTSWQDLKDFSRSAGRPTFTVIKQKFRC
jgi:RNA recognition motif-containing protein